MKNCPSCATLIDENAIFCAFCGFNLLTDSRIKKASSIVEMNSQLKLNKDIIVRYQDLESNINNLIGIEDELEQQTIYLKNLYEMLEKENSHLKQLSAQRYKEFKDVEKLKKLSTSSIFARIKGDREEKIKREELEYFTILNKEESSQTEVKRLNKLIQETEKQIHELKRLITVKNELDSELEGLIYDICEGVPDPIEDKIENQLLNLINQINPLNKDKGRYFRSEAHLRNAYHDLEEGLQLLHSASNYANWDSFFGGGLFVDSMKHSKMADARNYVHRAQSEIQLANRELPELAVSGNVHIEDISFFWDGFMDNIFSDFSARGKIQRSRESVSNALDEVQNALHWVGNQLNYKNQEINRLENEIKDTRKKLFQERKRMIEEAIKNPKDL